MNLYEIQAEILDCIDTETGEILDAEKLDALQMERKEKIRNIALWIKNLRGDVYALANEEKTFAERRRAAERKIESLSEYLKAALNGEKVKEAEFEISWRKSKSTEIVDTSQIPDRYWKTAEPTLNKAEMLKALRAGQEIPGAKMTEKQSIVIK